MDKINVKRDKKDEKRSQTPKKKHLNNLQDKIENKVKVKEESSSVLNLNLRYENGEKRCCNKNVALPVTINGAVHRNLCSRAKFSALYTSSDLDSHTASKPSTLKENYLKKLEGINQYLPDGDRSDVITSVGLAKINYDVKIDPNVDDRYTDKPIELLPGTVMPPPESPETKKRRIEKENMVVARQGRLHPSNKKYNQGPVINPPLISPGKVVGFTPAGQKHEVNLNFERPTWFNSEYARMQFDDATKINVSRMFHDLETGMFLPNSLDANVERKYFAERDLVTKDATKYFESVLTFLDENEVSEKDEGPMEHILLLETEQKIIQLYKCIQVKFPEHPTELLTMLNDLIGLKLTPLMFKKNPAITEAIEYLTKQNINCEVIKPALALLNKIKGLFDVPEDQTFYEFFSSEVNIFKIKTNHMNGFEILTMTEEPEYLLEKGANEEAESEEEPQDILFAKPLDNSVAETEDEWVPVEDGDHWVDINESGDEESPSNYNQGSNYYNDEDGSSLADSSDSYTTDGEEWTSTFDSNESDSDDDDETDNLIDAVYGMLIHGYPTYIVLNYFEYI